jgi:hypothetical protein
VLVFGGSLVQACEGLVSVKPANAMLLRCVDLLYASTLVCDFSRATRKFVCVWFCSNLKHFCSRLCAKFFPGKMLMYLFNNFGPILDSYKHGCIKDERRGLARFRWPGYHYQLGSLESFACCSLARIMHGL